MRHSLMIIIAAILMLTMAFTLTACGSDSKTDPTTAPTEAQPSDGAIAVADTTFVYNNISVALDGSIEEAIAALGEPLDVKSELSCHGEGDDKTYTYDGFVVKSYPKDGVDRVLEVLINIAGIPTSKGIEIGSSLDDVIAAYGSSYNTIAKFYVYNAGGGKTLRFYIEDNTVAQIDYYFNV